MKRLLETPTLPTGLLDQLKNLAPPPLLLIDHEESTWSPFLKASPVPPRWWTVLYSGPAEGENPELNEQLRQHPKLRQGGVAWAPESPGARLQLPARWKFLPPPWSVLAGWYLNTMSLKGKHVTLVAGPESGLENLTSSIGRQGASLSWCQDNSRHLWSQLRLSDVVMVFPGCQLPLEASLFNAGVTLLDFRPESPPMQGSALGMLVQAYQDAHSGLLDLLPAALAISLISRKETLSRLA